MGLLIMAVIITVICYIIFDIVDEKSEEVGMVFASLTICGLISIGIFLMIAGAAGLKNKSARERYQTTYNNLIARIEKSDPSDAMLLHDVQEYNEKIVNKKHWRNSFWTNIYNEKCVLEFETIDISE